MVPWAYGGLGCYDTVMATVHQRSGSDTKLVQVQKEERESEGEEEEN